MIKITLYWIIILSSIFIIGAIIGKIWEDKK